MHTRLPQALNHFHRLSVNVAARAEPSRIVEAYGLDFQRVTFPAPVHITVIVRIGTVMVLGVYRKHTVLIAGHVYI